MSTTPAFDAVHAALHAMSEDILRMCADIESNLADQQAMLARLRRVLESHGVRVPAE